MTKKELNKVLELHRKYLNGDKDGVKVDLRGTDLRGADLHDADLHDAYLHYADLRGACLRGAKLNDVNLHGADLYNADLSGADLRGADLRDADLRGADLSEANLYNADLRGANLQGADIDYSDWPLWCVSLDVKIDARIAAQLAYHVVRACQSVTDDAGVSSFCNAPEVVELANRFHRTKECGVIKVKK